MVLLSLSNCWMTTVAAHPGQPRCAGPIHAFQRVGDRDQPGADATVALAPRAGAASATEGTRKEP
jgi:hypothetical protein